MCPYVTHERNSLNKFPPLTSLHAQVPGNRSQLFNGGGKSTVKFPAGLWGIWSASNSGAADDTSRDARILNAFRQRTMQIRPPPFPFSRRAVGGLCTSVYGEIHILYSSHLLSADAHAHEHAHVHTQRQRKLKSLVTIIRLKALSIVHNLLRLVLPN